MSQKAPSWVHFWVHLIGSKRNCTLFLAPSALPYAVSPILLASEHVQLVFGRALSGTVFHDVSADGARPLNAV